MPFPLLHSLLLCTATLPQGSTCLETHLRAADGQAGPEGGQLVLAVPEGNVNLASGGRVALTARVAGPARDQGVFASDGVFLRAITFGCGGPAGGGSFGSCGDPAPGGGSFRGFFDLSFAAIRAPNAPWWSRRSES